MATFHVIYHSPCPDGVFAAFAASLWFEKAGIDPLGDRIKWCPMEVFKPAADQFSVESVKAADEVFLLDYTGDATFVLDLASRCSRCTVLDHHATALNKLRAALEKVEAPPSLKLVLDMNRSGAMIALDYFSSRPAPTKASEDAAEPAAKRSRSVETTAEWTSDYSRLFRDEAEVKRLLRIFRFVEDADVWHWWLEGSKDFHCGFCSLRLDMNPTRNPGLFQTLRDLRAEDVMKIGAAEREATEKVIAKELERTFELEIAPASNIRCLGVITERGELRSSMGHEIALKSKALGFRGLGCVIYTVPGLPEGKIKLSVRGIEGENSLEVTECFGGGGHKGASSCNVDIKALESWSGAKVPEATPAAEQAIAEARKCEKHGLRLMLAFGCPCCKPEDP